MYEYFSFVIVLSISFIGLLTLKLLEIDTFNYDIFYTIFIVSSYYVSITIKNKKFLMNTWICRQLIGYSYVKNIKRECNICLNDVNIMLHRESKMISSCHSCRLYLCVDCFSNLEPDNKLKMIACPICRSIIFSEIFEDN